MPSQSLDYFWKEKVSESEKVSSSCSVLYLTFANLYGTALLANPKRKTFIADERQKQTEMKHYCLQTSYRNVRLEVFTLNKLFLEVFQAVCLFHAVSGVRVKLSFKLQEN